MSFNQEKALVGAFSMIKNLRMDLFQAVVDTRTSVGGVDADGAVAAVLVSSALPLVARVTLRRRLHQQRAN